MSDRLGTVCPIPLLRHHLTCWAVSHDDAFLCSFLNTSPTRNLSNRMQKCSAIWVCADITRAVDNKTAKDLLGESFR